MAHFAAQFRINRNLWGVFGPKPVTISAVQSTVHRFSAGAGVGKEGVDRSEEFDAIEVGGAAHEGGGNTRESEFAEVFPWVNGV